MSTVITDNLTGKTSAGNVTITAGSATMQLQQGLAKVWSNLNGTGTIAARDSFSITSYTDNGTGDYTHTFTNAMGNVNYCWQLTVDYEAGTARNGNIGGDSSSQTTAAIRLHSYGLSNSVADDFDTLNVSLLGDLS